MPIMQKASLQAGFSLIELLVAMVVMSAGVLGMASMQAVSQRFNHTAYLRSQAVFQVYDMTDRMRANPVGLNSGAYSSIATTTASTTPAVNCKTATAGCSPAQLAIYDAWAWNTQTGQILPSGVGAVTFNTSASTYTVTVSWDDDRDGVLEDFRLEFRP